MSSEDETGGSEPIQGKAASGSSGSATEEQNKRQEWAQNMRAFQSTLNSRIPYPQEKGLKELWRAKRKPKPDKPKTQPLYSMELN